MAYLTVSQARALANPRKDSDSGLTSIVPGDGDMMTLRDGFEAGVLPWKYEAAKKRVQRKVGNPPSPRGQRGNADLYARADLEAWVARSRQEVS